MIEAVTIVLPVHDEEVLLPQCLNAISAARECAHVPVRLVVVLDSCRDASARIAERAVLDGDQLIRVEHRAVGAARARGARAALEALRPLSPERVWLTTTDADSRVPIDWLPTQLELARRGAAAVAGTVDIDDWKGYPPERARSYGRFYAKDHAGAHPHVHGANLGVRGDAYLAVGGFAPLRTGEDVALWEALGERALPRVSTRAIPVMTSSRRRGRAPAGFAAFLEGWAAGSPQDAV